MVETTMNQTDIAQYAYNAGFEAATEYLGGWDFAVLLPTDILKDIGRLYVIEGPEAAEELLTTELRASMDVLKSEGKTGRALTHVDEHARLAAGYELDENGATLTEGNFGPVEDAHILFEAGFEDALRGREKGYLLEDHPLA